MKPLRLPFSFRKLSLLPCLFLVPLSFAAAAESFEPKVIYGDDNRVNLNEVTDPALLRAARSTAALFRSSNVSRRRLISRNVSLRLKSYQKELNLCSDERFVDEFTGAFCSASLVAPDLVMTAGHCIRSERDCSNTSIVFDFAITGRGDNTPRSVPASSIYSCKKIVARRLDAGEGVDYAVVQLDREVTDRSPLPLARKSTLGRGTPLVVIGHPSGLATKIAAGAAVREVRDGYFVANLDTYGGNSGSAVLNATTGEVEGILVRGEMDFVTRSGPGQSCTVSKRCANGACRGEDVTLVSELLEFVPAL